MWYHLQQLWKSSRFFQVAVVAAVIGIGVLLVSQSSSSNLFGIPNPSAIIDDPGKAAADVLSSATGMPVPVPSSCAGQVKDATANAGGVAKKAVGVAVKAVGVADKAVDAGGKVVDVGAGLVDQFIGDPPANAGTTGGDPAPGNKP
jgi:hypothetical protein